MLLPWQLTYPFAHRLRRALLVLFFARHTPHFLPRSDCVHFPLLSTFNSSCSSNKRSLGSQKLAAFTATLPSCRERLRELFLHLLFFPTCFLTDCTSPAPRSACAVHHFVSTLALFVGLPHPVAATVSPLAFWPSVGFARSMCFPSAAIGTSSSASLLNCSGPMRPSTTLGALPG